MRSLFIKTAGQSEFKTPEIPCEFLFQQRMFKFKIISLNSFFSLNQAWNKGKETIYSKNDSMPQKQGLQNQNQF